MTRFGLNILICLLLSGVATANSIALRDSVRVDSAAVTLGDVAKLNGMLVKDLADIEIATFAPQQQTLTVYMADLRKQLASQGVHWGKVSLRGAQQISVQRKVNRPVKSAGKHRAVEVATPGKALANPIAAMNAGPSPIVAGHTLRDRLTAWVTKSLGVKADDIKIEYQRPDDAAWHLSALDGRFEFQPINKELVGRVPVLVRQYRSDHRMQTVRVAVNVKRRITVVKAVRRLQRGQIVTAGDVQVGTMWQTTAMRPALTDAKAIVGQSISRNVRVGDVIGRDDFNAPVVIRRGQLVTVRVVSGQLVLRSVLRATEDGAVGQLIKVKNEKTRQVVNARVTGPQEAVMVLRNDPVPNGIARGGSS